VYLCLLANVIPQRCKPEPAAASLQLRVLLLLLLQAT
jgi:hypothetical protein